MALVGIFGTGIIPACAGSTFVLPHSGHGFRDHPRLRGEHLTSRRPCPWPAGSSPLARGARVAGRVDVREGGIIPACAGSTWLARCSSSPAWDHPRLRGEHRRALSVPTSCPGSSPLARGAQRGRPVRPAARGIIPACAGSTSFRRLVPSGSEDHPRLRGEHPTAAAMALRASGSSPLARGALRFSRRSHRQVGIIPACAGSTSSTSSTPRRRRDHPRLRGEHQCCSGSARSCVGSSPLARGALFIHVKTS